MVKKLLLSAFLALGLTACASTLPSGLLPPDALYPVAMTDCTKFDPGPPRADKHVPRTDKEKANLVAGLYDAYKDCKAKVESWKERRDLYQKQYDAENVGPIQRTWLSITGETKKD